MHFGCSELSVLTWKRLGSVAQSCYRSVTDGGGYVDSWRGAHKWLEHSGLQTADGLKSCGHGAQQCCARTLPPYQRSLRPNWTWRLLVVVEVMAPAVPETGRILGGRRSENDQVGRVEVGAVEEV